MHHPDTIGTRVIDKNLTEEAGDLDPPLDRRDRRPEAAVPAPRAPHEASDATAPTVAQAPVARMVLARARVRATVPLDIVAFTAACPACGQDCEWTQERRDTCVRSTTACLCDE